jgi:NAD(P)-dependent dehydrogenase (short-subunit alcohol dehydrogenase family)
MTDLTGRRVVILGASSGIGRSLALHVRAAGADVLLSGRRADRLQEVRTEAGGGSTCAVDLADPVGIVRLGEDVSRLAPVDAVISTVGAAQLKLLEHTTEADWKTVLDTNVVGVNSAIRVMLPSLATGAIVLALSSEAVTMPRWALGAYGASKAALEVSMAGWRLEFPRARFGTVGVGSTVPTEFGRAFEGEILGQALEMWTRHGQAQEAFMDSDHVGQVLASVLASLLPFPGINMEHMVLRTPTPAVGTSDLMRAAIES